jgi:hypothetical protein
MTTCLKHADPTFAVSDVGATMRWYEEYLGFTAVPYPDEEPYEFARLHRDGVEILLQRVQGYHKPNLYHLKEIGAWDAFIEVQGVRELYEAIRNRVHVMVPLAREVQGDLEFEVTDPNGYVLVFSEMSQE